MFFSALKAMYEGYGPMKDYKEETKTLDLGNDYAFRSGTCQCTLADGKVIKFWCVVIRFDLIRSDLIEVGD